MNGATSSTVAWFDDGFLSAGTQYFHQDMLSNRMITDTGGNDIGEQGHYPFGEQWYAMNTTTKWFFTTYEGMLNQGTTMLWLATIRTVWDGLCLLIR